MKRYDGIEEDKEGTFVLFTDHEEAINYLERIIEEQRKANDELNAECVRLGSLEVDVEAATKALEQELLNYQAVALQEGAEKAAEVIRQIEREACAGIVRTNIVMRGSLNEALHAIRQRGEE